MRTLTSKLLHACFGILFLAVAAPVCVQMPTFAQDNPEVYSATLIASEGLAGGTAGRIVIRIGSQTSAAEKTTLQEAFKKNQQDGLALLRTMSKGFINVEGQPGRKIFAVFKRNREEGHELIVISEHVASKLEQWRGVKAEEHPLAVVHLRFDTFGAIKSSEVFPAVKVSVTEDGYVDVQTDNTNKITMIDLKRQ
jgi:hypothetical protein